MKRSIPIFVFLLVVFSSNIFADWTGNANLFLGRKALEEDDWSPADVQNEFGALIDFRPQKWPVNFSIDYLVAVKDVDFQINNVTVASLNNTVWEFNFGVRKIWEKFKHTRPFIGAGINRTGLIIELYNELTGEKEERSPGAWGYWLELGIYWTLYKHFNIGLNTKISGANVEYQGFSGPVEVDGGGTHLGILIGYHWGKYVYEK